MRQATGVAITGVVILALWEAVARLEIVDRALLPPASVVLAKLGAELVSPDFPRNLGATLGLMLSGFVLAIFVGVPLGIALGLSRTMDALLSFYVDFLRSLPAAALIPMFLVLFTGQLARVLVIATACGLITAIGSRSGVRGASPVRREVAGVLGWRPYELFRKLLIWEMIPSVALSARIALSMALILATVIEMLLGARYGLGDVLFDSAPVDKARMYAVILILGSLGYLLNVSFRLVETALEKRGLSAAES